jgi:hypothetical protein
VTWLEARHMLGVWGEQRMRNCIDASQTINSDQNPSEIAAVALALQTGLIAVVDVQSTLTDLNSLRLALRAREDFIAANNSADAKHKNTFSAQKVAQNKKSPLDNAPPVPPPQILPEIARIVVALPPAPTEVATIRRDRLLNGAGGNRAAHSAAVSSRFVGVHVLDGLAVSRVLSVTDYGRVFVHQRDAAQAATDAAAWSFAQQGDDGEPGVSLFSVLPPLPRGVIAGPSVKGGPVRCAYVRQNATLAYGGRSIDLKLRDLETGATTFAAKNLPNTAARLEVPVWVTDIGLHHADDRIATVSAFCDLRVYDPRSKRRAIFATKFREGGALKSIEVSPDDLTYIISDNKGYVSLWCARQQKELGGLKMAAGAQLATAHHPTKPLVATTGLDRFVHVYNKDNRRRVSAFYLKQRMTSVYLSHEDEPVAMTVVIADPVERRNVERKRLASDTNTEWETVDGEDDEDDVWAQMQVAEEGEEEEEEEEDDDDDDDDDQDDDQDDDDNDDDDESDEEPVVVVPPKRRRRQQQ